MMSLSSICLMGGLCSALANMLSVRLGRHVVAG
jgi:hypothetical protein